MIMALCVSAAAVREGAEPVWPSGKAYRLVSGRTSVRLSASAHPSLHKLWLVDTVFVTVALHNL